MKKIVSILLTAALIFTLAGCTDTTPPAVDDTSSTISSETTSSKEEASSIPQSSEAPSSVIESSETPSSMTEEEKVKPVSPPKDPNAEDPHEWTKEEMDAAWIKDEAERIEFERLLKLTTEYTAELDKTTYPLDTENIFLTVKNKGPGALYHALNHAIDKFDGSEWVNVRPFYPPPTIGYNPMKPNTDLKISYRMKDILTEPGLYRVHQQFSYADVKEDKTYEFTLE